MSAKDTVQEKLVEDVSVRRVPVFSSPGSSKKFEYMVSLTTVKGNTGTFDVKQEVYENDERFTEWLQEAVFQLDKVHQVTGL